MNKGTVYALWDYESQNQDELSFSEGDAVTILRRQDDSETEWWWARLEDNEGYVPRNLLGVMTITNQDQHICTMATRLMDIQCLSLSLVTLNDRMTL